MAGHVLCELPISPKGFIPSVHNPNLIFLTSTTKSLCFQSKFLHWIPSVGWWSIASFLRYLVCHCNNSAFALFVNNRRKWGIMEKYHATLAGTLLTFYSPPCHLHWYFYHFGCIMMFCKHNIPPTWHICCEIACSHFNMHVFSPFLILTDKQFS
jgi:hypothetical protein